MVANIVLHILSLHMRYQAVHFSLPEIQKALERMLLLTLVDKSLSDITDGSQLDHRTNGVTLDGLVLGDAARAVGAADGLDVAATVLVASVVSSLDGLLIG